MMAGVTSAGPSQDTPSYGGLKFDAGSRTVYEPGSSPKKRKEPSAAVVVLATVFPSRAASTFISGSPLSPRSTRPCFPPPPGVKSR